MDTVKKNIKDMEFHNVYLIFGEEEYLKRNVKKNLLNAIVPSEDTMNRARYEGKGINVKEVIDVCETMPFFADRRLVVLERTGFFKSVNEDMLEYLSEIPEFCHIVFVEEDVDKRGRMYKAVGKYGHACECARQKDGDLVRWVYQYLTREQKKVKESTIRYFLEQMGNNMEKLEKELEKLVSYTYGREIVDVTDVDSVCCPEITGKIFDMIDAMGNKNRSRTMELYYDLISCREPEARILFMLARQFNLLLQMKELTEERMSTKMIAEKMGIQEFIVKKSQGQLRNFSYKEIKGALSYAVELEEAVKSGNLADSLAVEMLLNKYSA